MTVRTLRTVVESGSHLPQQSAPSRNLISKSSMPPFMTPSYMKPFMGNETLKLTHFRCTAQIAICNQTQEVAHWNPWSSSSFAICWYLLFAFCANVIFVINLIFLFGLRAQQSWKVGPSLSDTCWMVWRFVGLYILHISAGGWVGGLVVTRARAFHADCIDAPDSAHAEIFGRIVGFVSQTDSLIVLSVWGISRHGLFLWATLLVGWKVTLDCVFQAAHC